VFRGDHEGRVIAEIQLRDDREGFDRPPWLGVEVTRQPQYYTAPWPDSATVPLRSPASAG
jgi:CYTH domain-containing protein